MENKIIIYIVLVCSIISTVCFIVNLIMFINNTKRNKDKLNITKREW